MTSFVYLVRNGDLYKIGSTKNLDKELNQLKPDEIILTIKTPQPKAIEARLLRRYKNKRIPESGYFRLDEGEILDCKEQMGPDSVIPNTLDAEFRIALIAFFLSLFFLFIISRFFDSISYTINMLITLLINF